MNAPYNLRTVIAARAEQRSYHLASEEHVRVEIFNMKASEAIGPFAYGGDLVMTCYRGTFRLAADRSSHALAELDQVILPARARVAIECVHDGTIQVIWAPGHAPVIHG